MDENNENILNQDSWLPATPSSIGGYLKIDLNKVDLVTYSLNKRFRQGENGADLKMWFYDGNIPHQLDPDNSSVTLYGEDSNGKYKVVTAQPDSDWQSGRVVMYLPSQCFASSGQYKRMVIEVKNNDQVIATINFNLDVLPNDFYNINLGSVNFSSALTDQIVTALNKANAQVESSASAADDAVKKFQSDYDALNTIANNIKSKVDDSDVVSKASFDDMVNKLSSKVYKASDIEWQSPFKSWVNAGGTSLAVHDGIVDLSIATISPSNGSTICILPEDCRPQSEKIGVGISMNSEGHDAVPVFISIVPDGRVIVQNNTHDDTKIIAQSTYTLALDDSEKNTSTPVSIVEDITKPTNTPIAGTYKAVNVYAPDGTIGRELETGTTFAIIQIGTMNGKKVGRVATSEWVNLDEVAYSYVVPSGNFVASGSAQTAYHESGLAYNVNLVDGTPYKYTRKIEVDGKVGYKIATDEYVDSQYGTLS